VSRWQILQICWLHWPKLNYEVIMNFNLKSVKNCKNSFKVANFTNISDGSYGSTYPPSRSLMTLHKPDFLSFTLTLETTLSSIFGTDGKY